MGLTTSPPACAECHEIWEPKLPGTLWATPGMLRDCFIVIYIYFNVFLSIMVSNPTQTALRVLSVSVRWPVDGQVRPKHVAIKVKKTNK